MEKTKVVIIGHIDHGKSTLIGRILYETNSLSEDKMKEIKKVCEDLGRITEFAYLIDNLQEEREEQYTLDTTQTFFKTGKRSYIIIDAPGHKEFIKNMITGASQADLAILLIDSKEGIKEQTKRHAYIIKMLGIKNLIVAINKMDLINYEKSSFNRIKDEIINSLSRLNLKPNDVIPISALLGENILKKSDKLKWYNGLTLLSSLDSIKIEKEKEGVLRFPVQDIYQIEGKSIIVGRIESGSLKKGEEIVILPEGENNKIKTIETIGPKKDFVKKGESIGITLEKTTNQKIGSIICKKDNLPLITKEFKAKIFWMSDKSLNLNEEVTIKCATQESKCKISEISKKIDSSTLRVLEEKSNKLNETEVGEVVINTNKDLVIENFEDIPELGRFVIKRDSDIVGAGVISNH